MNSPLVSVVAVRVVLVPASVAVTRAAAIGNPDGSFTVPRRLPVVWAITLQTVQSPPMKRIAPLDSLSGAVICECLPSSRGAVPLPPGNALRGNHGEPVLKLFRTLSHHSASSGSKNQ